MLKSILIYVFTLIWALIFSYLYEKINKKVKLNFKGRILCLFTIIFPLLVISSIRYAVGTDYFTYKDIYIFTTENINFSNIFSFYIEPLYVLVNMLAKILFNNAQGVFFLSSLIFLIFSILGIDNFRKKISFPFAVFIFFTVFFQISFNNVRQMIAVSIVFYALKYIYDRKLYKYILFVIIASMFHKTSIVCIIFYFLMPSRERTGKSGWQFYILNILVCVLMPLMIYCLKYILHYMGTNYYSYLELGGVKNFNFLLYVLPTLIPVLIFRKKLLIDDYKNEFLIRLLFLQLPTQLAGYYIMYLDRMSLYVSISQILLIPILINAFKNKKYGRWLKYGFIAWYVFYYIVMFIILNGNQTYPYSSIFM